MEDLNYLFILFIIVLIFFLYYESKYSQLTYVKSNVDDRQYLVRNRKDKQEASDLLGNIRKNLDNIVSSLIQKYPDENRIKRLKQNYNPEKISESIPHTDYTSYSVNKGEQIVFCLRSKDEEEKLIDLNTIMFVAIHELAHVMTKSVGHTDEFWANMKYLLQESIKLGVYNEDDYRVNPKKYCGTEITDSPLYDDNNDDNNDDDK